MERGRRDGVVERGGSRFEKEVKEESERECVKIVWRLGVVRSGWVSG